MKSDDEEEMIKKRIFNKFLRARYIAKKRINSYIKEDPKYSNENKILLKDKMASQSLKNIKQLNNIRQKLNSLNVNINVTKELREENDEFYKGFQNIKDYKKKYVKNYDENTENYQKFEDIVLHYKDKGYYKIPKLSGETNNIFKREPLLIKKTNMQNIIDTFKLYPNSRKNIIFLNNTKKYVYNIMKRNRKKKYLETDVEKKYSASMKNVKNSIQYRFERNIKNKFLTEKVHSMSHLTVTTNSQISSERNEKNLKLKYKRMKNTDFNNSNTKRKIGNEMKLIKSIVNIKKKKRTKTNLLDLEKSLFPYNPQKNLKENMNKNHENYKEIINENLNNNNSNDGNNNNEKTTQIDLILEKENKKLEIEIKNLIKNIEELEAENKIEKNKRIFKQLTTKFIPLDVSRRKSDIIYKKKRSNQFINISPTPKLSNFSLKPTSINNNKHRIKYKSITETHNNYNINNENTINNNSNNDLFNTINNININNFSIENIDFNEYDKLKSQFNSFDTEDKFLEYTYNLVNSGQYSKVIIMLKFFLKHFRNLSNQKIEEKLNINDKNPSIILKNIREINKKIRRRDIFDKIKTIYLRNKSYENIMNKLNKLSNNEKSLSKMDKNLVKTLSQLYD